MPGSDLESPPTAVAVRKRKESVRPPDLFLNEQDVAEFREIFCLVDSDGSGCISTDEMKQLIESVGMKLDEFEFSQMMNEVDTDGSGEIDFDEFISTMSKGLSQTGNTEGIRALFQQFARNAPPGMIRKADLAESLSVCLWKTGIDHITIADLLAKFEGSMVTLPNVFDKNGLPTQFFKYDDYINLISADRPTSGSPGSPTAGANNQEKTTTQPQEK